MAEIGMAMDFSPQPRLHLLCNFAARRTRAADDGPTADLELDVPILGFSTSENCHQIIAGIVAIIFSGERYSNKRPSIRK